MADDDVVAALAEALEPFYEDTKYPVEKAAVDVLAHLRGR